jgi:hypothetical protein
LEISIPYSLAEFSAKIAFFTAPSAGPSDLNPCFFRMALGISILRIASICHCGDPHQTESVP